MNMNQTIRNLFSRAAMMLLATILLTMTAQTAWAQLTMNGVKYIDANGVEQTRDGVIVLNGSETTLGENGGTSESPKEVWYICNTNLSYTSTLYSYYYSSVNIILADGVEMKVENSSSGAIYFPGSLGIYGQSTGTTMGKLTATGGSSNGIYANNDVVISSAEVTAEGSDGIYTTVGSVSITGGKVTANGTSSGIDVSGTNKNITISGAEVTATATGTSSQAICASNGSISITGGKITAKGSDNGIYANNDVVISSAEVTAEGSYGIYTTVGSVSITGGKVTANGTSFGIDVSGTNKNITINGSEVTATATGTSGQAIYASGCVTINDGSIVSSTGSNYGIYANNDITISDSEVTATGNDAIYAAGGGISITGGKVTANGTSTGIYAYKGGAFSNCTISGEVGIAAYSSAAVTIGAGVEINGYTKAGIKNYGNLTLKALPKFTAGSGATYQDIMLIKRDDLPVIVFDATGLSAPEKKISVGTYQSDASTAITSTYFFTQGYGSAFSDAESGDVVDPKDVFDVSGGTAVYVGTEVMASNDAQPLVAFILDADDSLELYVKDGTDIDTDIKALEKALSDAEAYCTVRLVKDITDVNTTITVDKEGAPITLELDHCGISGSVSGALLTIESGTALTIVGSGETAKIENMNTSDGPIAILNNGTLTISGVTVMGSNGISNDGTLNITDTSVEATNSYGDGICNNGSLTMSSSSVTGNEVGIYNEGSLTLTSGNVKGYQFAISNTIDATACSIGDVTFVAYTGIYIRNDVTFTAWPTFSGTTTDIQLDKGKKIILANGIGAPADDYGKVSVKVFMLSNENLDAAFQFTSGFSSIDGAVAGTLLPCDVFDMVTKQGGTMRVGEKQGEGYIVPVTVAQQTLMPGWNTWIDDKSQAVGVSAEGIATYAVTQVEGDAVSVASLPDGLIQAGMPILIYNGSSEIATVGITTLDNEYFARETSRSLSQALGSSAETSPCFQGTVGGKTLTASDDYDYFGCNGEAFVSLDLPAEVAAHRCWLALPKSSGNGGSPSGTRSLTIGFGGDGDGTTGVREIKEVREVTDDTWYTLEGMKLSGKPQKKGIYIMNGKKVIIKK